MIEHSVGLIVLAGGEAVRMGGVNKALQLWQGKPLIAWILAEHAAHVNATVISANRDVNTFSAYGHSVTPDLPAYVQLGPLAGIISAARQLPTSLEYIQVLPCDTPMLPACVVQTLHTALLSQPAADIAVATSPSGWHPVVCQFHRRHLQHIESSLLQPGSHSVRSMIEPYAHACVHFAEDGWFQNCNTRSDLLALPHTEGPTP